MKRIVSILIIVAIAASCSTVRRVRPLKQSEHKVAVAAGGSIHLTPIIFGMFGFGEINATIGIVSQTGFVPAMAFQGSIHLLSDSLRFSR